MKMRISSLIVLCLLLVVQSLFAQDPRGSIVGIVTDPTGLIIPNVPVEVTNVAMGTKALIKTNESGYYQASLLIPGLYRVTAELQGFKKTVRDNIEVRVNDRLEINVMLEVGGTEQSVTVTESTPQMTTESGSIGSVVNSQQIRDLPLSYGNPFALIAVSTGTGFLGSPRLDRPFEPTHIANFSMNGTNGDRSDITLDGAPATSRANGGQVTASYVPPTDILAEFKVQTAVFDAAAGNTEGGVTNFSIKSGTNAFHGTGYYGWTRKDFWANDFFNNRLGKDRPDFSFNRYGGSIGGPVTLPKIYDGKNKTFFLFGYEGIRDSRPRYDATTPQVPTAEMKKGDFSSLLAPAAGGQTCVAATTYNCYQIFNPFTRKAVGSRFQEDPFAGNIIPSSLFNPVGKTILDKYYPAATSTANADGSNNLQQADLAETARYYNFTTRIDQNISDRQRMFGRFSMYRRSSDYNNYFHNDATGIVFLFDSYNGVLDHTFVLTPTTILDVRYGYNRFIRGSDGNANSAGFDLTQLGFPASYNSLIPPSVRRFPRIDLTGYIGTAFTGEYRPTDIHNLAASVTKSISKHSLRGGVDWRSYRQNDGFFSNDQTGRFIFDSSYTKGPLDNATAAPNSFGQSVAALLLGLPSSSSVINRTADYAEQSMTYGVYFQDDWKITPKLTINLGVRWEMETPMTERYGRSVQTFDPKAAQPFAAAVLANYTKNPLAVPAAQFNVNGGLVFSNGGDLYHTPKTNFMPRFGFAYQLPKDTVVRGGFGAFNGFLGQRRGDVIQTGFSRSTTFNAFGTDNTTIVRTLSNPWPDGILEPVGSAQGAQTNIGQAISFYNQDPKVPVNYRWQVGLQHQFKGSVLVEANYVGNKGYRIELTRNINGLSNQYLSTSPFRDNTTNAFVTASIANPFAGVTLPIGTPSGYAASTISRQTLLLPFPQFGSITTTTNEGYSWYHGIQFRAEKRFSHGLSLVGNYTFSKFMDATELLNAGDAAPTHQISASDIPHRITSSVIYSLPFGKGRKLAGNLNGWADRLVGGWEATGIWAFQSGTPLPFGSYSTTATTNSGDFFWASIDPATAYLPLNDRSIDRGWFNQSAFVTVASAQPVTHLRVNPYRYTSLRGPRQNNVDLSVIKDVRISEGVKARFSAQALNAFNHPLFPNPNLTYTASQFGLIAPSTQNNYPRRLQLELKFIF